MASPDAPRDVPPILYSFDLRNLTLSSTTRRTVYLPPILDAKDDPSFPFPPRYPFVNRKIDDYMQADCPSWPERQQFQRLFQQHHFLAMFNIRKLFQIPNPRWNLDHIDFAVFKEHILRTIEYPKTHFYDAYDHVWTKRIIDWNKRMIDYKIYDPDTRALVGIPRYVQQGLYEYADHLNYRYRRQLGSDYSILYDHMQAMYEKGWPPWALRLALSHHEVNSHCSRDRLRWRNRYSPHHIKDDHPFLHLLFGLIHPQRAPSAGHSARLPFNIPHWLPTLPKYGARRPLARRFTCPDDYVSPMAHHPTNEEEAAVLSAVQQLFTLHI